jgi:16S rRNA (uracil1498-N3)-methyltransferase
MRAVYCEIENSTQIGDEVVIDGDRAHHLQVVRVKKDEEILALNGKGSQFFATISEVTKKEIVLKIISSKFQNLKSNIELAIALPKKDAFEDILKIAVELGVSKIYPLSSEFSQYEYSFNDRVGRLLESALVQSNNLYLPILADQESLGQFLIDNKSPIAYFSAANSEIKLKQSTEEKIIILIGPEGGFSEREESQIIENENVSVIHLPTPILRAPTAVAASVGYLLGLAQ